MIAWPYAGLVIGNASEPAHRPARSVPGPENLGITMMPCPGFARPASPGAVQRTGQEIADSLTVVF